MKKLLSALAILPFMATPAMASDFYNGSHDGSNTGSQDVATFASSPYVKDFVVTWTTYQQGKVTASEKSLLSCTANRPSWASFITNKNIEICRVGYVLENGQVDYYHFAIVKSKRTGNYIVIDAFSTNSLFLDVSDARHTRIFASEWDTAEITNNSITITSGKNHDSKGNDYTIQQFTF